MNRWGQWLPVDGVSGRGEAAGKVGCSTVRRGARGGGGGEIDSDAFGNVSALEEEVPGVVAGKGAI